MDDGVGDADCGERAVLHGGRIHPFVYSGAGELSAKCGFVPVLLPGVLLSVGILAGAYLTIRRPVVRRLEGSDFVS